MNPFKLVFGKSIYKKNLESYDWFLKTNNWRTFGKGVIVIFIFFYFTSLTIDGKEESNIDAFKVFIAFVMSFEIYKAIVSLVRYVRKTYPIYGITNLTKSDRRFKTGQKTIGQMLKIIGREKIKPELLTQHKKEQFAKFLYHTTLIVVCLFIFFNIL
jgi:hypothetical protein